MAVNGRNGRRQPFKVNVGPARHRLLTQLVGAEQRHKGRTVTQQEVVEQALVAFARRNHPQLLRRSS